MSKSERAQTLCYDWIKWLNTRRFLAIPHPKHILAVLSIPDTSGDAPDAIMSADIAAFHLGVCSLPDSLLRPFVKVYCGFPAGKTYAIAREEGISERTYYVRAHKGAEAALIEMQRSLNRLEFGWSHPILNR